MLKQPKFLLIGAAAVVLVLLSIFSFKSSTANKPKLAPAPTPSSVASLNSDELPEVSLSFTPDGHYTTVSITNIFADQLEYNIIYDALVKGNRIQAGVNASKVLDGKTNYSQKQLLGSESSGKFTFHQDISNAVLELTLRDSSGRSVYTASYPFKLSAGETQLLTPQE